MASKTEQGWYRWWVWLWGLLAVALLSIGFTHILGFRVWAPITGVVLGGMEIYGLRGPNDPYPPLTDVLAEFLPRTPAITLLYGVTVAEGAKWLHLPHPIGLTAVFALLGFLTAHFDARYDERSMEQERRKWERIPVVNVLTAGWRATRRPRGGRSG